MYKQRDGDEPHSHSAIKAVLRFVPDATVQFLIVY